MVEASLIGIIGITDGIVVGMCGDYVSAILSSSVTGSGPSLTLVYLGEDFAKLFALSLILV